MKVIDISSSPESPSSSMTRRSRTASIQPGPSRKRLRRPPLAREPSVVEVIELTDSDGEPPARRAKTRHSAEPHTIHAKTSHAALASGNKSHLDAPVESAPGSSRHVARGDGAPLFLPSSDDEQHAVRPLPALGAQDLPYTAPPENARPASPEPTAPQASPPLNPIDKYMVNVLEIVPDVQPAHALILIEQFMQSDPAHAVELVLHALFENPTYPKVDKKGKHKQDEVNSDADQRDASRPRVDYGDRSREWNGGPLDYKRYFEHSLEHLVIDFPRIPKPHIRSRLHDHRFYAPTYLLLSGELKQESPPFRLKSTSTVVSKGKSRQDPEFDKEREWVLLRVAQWDTEQDAALAASINEREYEDSGESIECGCCFSGYPFDQIIQCPEAHLFCKSCMTAYSSNLLGEHNPNIVCMDQSGCKLPFPETELARFLSPKLLELYYRVKQRKEIEEAGLENLEECPFCEYKCVIDNEMEKLFRCENAACGAVTCRACKKADHLPRSCKEMEDDKHLDAQHVIEEAMTQALMRNCPKCQKSFVKEMGCNKMTCPTCLTVSCYICRKVINGYDHFSNRPHGSGKVDKSKCNLWDPIEQRHAEEVSAAAKRALAELRKSRPDVDQSNIKVDLPVARAAAPPVPPPQLRPIAALPNRQAGLGLNGLAGLPPAYAAAGPAGAVGMAQWGGPAPGLAGGGGGAHMGMGLGAGANFHAAAAYARLNMGMGMGIGAGPLAGAGAGAGGIAMGAPLPPGAAAARHDPFVFGAGQGHDFVPPPAMGPLYQHWLDIRRQAGAGEVHAAPIPVPVTVPVPVPVPEAAEPLALARGRRVPARVPQRQPQLLTQPQIRPQVPVQAQVRTQAQLMAAGGGGQRHRGR